MPASLKSTSGWELHGTSPNDGANALVWNDDISLRDLGPTDVLVNKEPLIPDSDAAGEVLAIGTHVENFKPTDKVIIKFYPNYPHGVAPTATEMATVPGTSSPGTFRYHGVFDQAGLIAMPSTLTYAEAATLPCSALTAWNALNGLTPLKAGDHVLVQGTGGVSLFAVRFALAAGATVIATTSSEEKAGSLRAMGVQHVLNYRDDQHCGKTAKKLTRDGQGCQRIVEVGGQKTIRQSFECVAHGGEIGIVGFLTGQGAPDHEDELTFLEPLLRVCTVRGIEVGSHVLFEEMNRAIEGWDIKPVVDNQGWDLRALKEAYKFVWDQKHFGKLVLSA
ncbi:unnamed protein product [Penicillium salamii]|nr:unnamed protein product [Penicillium salamii]